MSPPDSGDSPNLSDQKIAAETKKLYAEMDDMRARLHLDTFKALTTLAATLGGIVAIVSKLI